MNKSLVIAAILLVLGSLPANGQDFARTVEVAQRGLTPDVLNVLRPLSVPDGLSALAAPANPRAAAEALRRYHVAAERGDPLAQSRLGLIYGRGLGVPQDFVAAHMWFTLASRHGVTEAAMLRNLIARLMSGTEIAEARSRARAWRETRIN